MIKPRARFTLTMITIMAGRGIVDFIIGLFRIVSMDWFVYIALYAVATLAVAYELDKQRLSKEE